VGDSSIPPSPDPDRSRTPTGIPVRFLVVGRILGPVGLLGDVRAQVHTDFPARFEQVETVHLGDRLRPYGVEKARVEGATVLLHLAGVDNFEAANALANQDVQIPISDAVSLPPGQFFWHEVVGMDVWSDNERYLGKIREVLRTGSNDVYAVWDGSRELLVPAIEDVVQRIDSVGQKMIVHLLPGLEEL